MDAIRKALEPKPDPIAKLAERKTGEYLPTAVGQALAASRAAKRFAPGWSAVLLRPAVPLR